MRKLNVRLATILLAITVVIWVGIYFLHDYQVRRNAYVFKDAADRAIERAQRAGEENDTRQEELAYGEALRKLGWYLYLRPDRVDVLEQYALLAADCAQTVAGYERAFNSLEAVLRQDPDRAKVRRRLVDLAMMMSRFQDAKVHLEFMLKQSPGDAELLMLRGQCEAELGDHRSAAESFKRAIESAHDQVGAYALLAGVLRYRMSRPTEADQWMEKLVKSNPQSARAHALRGNYLKSIDKNDDALAEALGALELAADDRDALRLAAQCTAAKGDYASARGYATRGVKAYPSDVGMYAVLAEIEMRDGKQDKAIEILQKGLKATDRPPQLLEKLAEAMIESRQLEDARKILQELGTTNYPRRQVEYLTARLEFVQGHWLAARRGFEKVRAMLTSQPAVLKQVDAWIGECYGYTGDYDQQLQACRQALALDPFYTPARAGAIAALRAAGRVDDAIEECLQMSRFGGITPDGVTSLARMLISKTLQRAPRERNWTAVERVLDQAEKGIPDTTQITILRADVLAAQDRLGEAERLLQEARQKNPKQSEFLVALASLAARRGDWAKAEEFLAGSRALWGDCTEQRLAQAEYLHKRYGREAAERLRELAEQTDKFSEPQRLRLWSGLLNIALQEGDTAQSKVLCRRIGDEEPTNVQVRYLLFELAYRAQDAAAMDQALAELKRVAGRNAFWLYGEAVRLMFRAQDAAGASPLLEQALSCLAEARGLRESWGRIPLLAGDIYYQQGKLDEALKNYQQAIELGERSPAAIQKTVQILFRKQRSADADQLLRRLEQEQGPSAEELSQANAAAALYKGEFRRAVAEARRAAARDSDDYQDRLWLGQVLAFLGRRASAEGQPGETEPLLADAEKALRRAVAIAPQVVETWVTLVQFLSAGGKEDKAEEVIAEASAKIPPQKAPLALAQCYEAIGRIAAADEKFEAALAASPQDPAVVRAVADFYYRTGKVAPAETLLRQIMEGAFKSPEADVIWARRQLALILVARGGYANVQKAGDLLEKNLAAGASSADLATRRIKASLDAASPKRSRREEAARMLEKMLQEQSATPQDRFALAQMYLASGSWVKANALLRNLVANYPDDLRYLTAYTAAQLQRGELSSAEMNLDRLEKVAPLQIATVSLRAEALVARDEPEKALKLLRDFLDKPGAQPKDPSQRLRLVAEKIEQLGRRLTKPGQEGIAAQYARQAGVLFRTYVQRNRGQELVLEAFLVRQGKIEEALDLLDQAEGSASAAVLAQACYFILSDGRADKEQLERLNRMLEPALGRFRRPAPLLLKAAELYTQLGRYADAEGLYREVLKKDGSNAAAMNNLAVLLALQGIQLDEALKLVNQAIETAGPMAAILDSRASVYMARGELNEAIKDLNEALAETESPVWLFHQARAYELAGRHNDAVAAMEKALKKGLARHMLQPLELPAFDKLRSMVK